MPEISPSRYLVCAGWDDVPHLSEQTKKELLASTPTYLHDARSKGIPALGSGAIFPFKEESITVDPFKIPKYWAEIIGLDIGYDHPTAAVNLAWDRDSDIVYVTKAYKKSQASPLIHSAAIKPWGDWKPVAWPHDGLQHDKGGSCEQIKAQYEGHGLNMLQEKSTHPEGGYGVEAGISELYERMESGRLYVFKNLLDWFMEFRLYHRKDGKIVKEFDDLMAATRYAHMMLRFAKTKPKRVAHIPEWKRRVMAQQNRKTAASA